MIGKISRGHYVIPEDGALIIVDDLHSLVLPGLVSENGDESL